MNNVKSTNACIKELKQRAQNRIQSSNGKVHPASADNEFFPSIRDNIYKQITKEKA